MDLSPTQSPFVTDDDVTEIPSSGEQSGVGNSGIPVGMGGIPGLGFSLPSAESITSQTSLTLLLKIASAIEGARTEARVHWMNLGTFQIRK